MLCGIAKKKARSQVRGERKDLKVAIDSIQDPQWEVVRNLIQADSNQVATVNMAHLY